jgi:hypothetical protein
VTIPKWAPSTLYNPGDFVVPRSNNIVTQEQPHNNSFEDGLTHWSQTEESGSSGTIVTATDQVFDGSQSVVLRTATGPELRNSGLIVLMNDFEAPVTPGKVINFSAYVYRTNVASGGVAGVADGGARLYWLNSSHDIISFTPANNYPGAIGGPPPGGTPAGFVGGSAPFQAWLKSVGKGTAPAGAAYAVAAIAFRVNNTGGNFWADNYVWDYTFQGIPTGLVFVATQAAAATSGAVEPAWPLESGESVTDGGVTWDAEFASRIIWQASPILESGSSEPTWPLQIGGSVVDAPGTNHAIAWIADDGLISDVNCPHDSQVVAIAQSKVFAADDDTIAFCATTNCLDWTTEFDAGYLPFGLQTYGSEPCSVLGLYRSNLIAMNSLGYQMWQIDPDPANMALLDAQPVGSTFPHAMAPVQNDLVFLTEQGIRSLGISGASGNIQAGQFGKNLDPLVIASIAGGLTPRGLFYPGTGQYWLAFGSFVYVQTNNGSGNANSWSVYEFPGPIDYWTVDAGVLYLRSNDLVWQVNVDALYDDIQDPSDQPGSGQPFTGETTWQYLDMGPVGVDKDFEGVNIVCEGTGEVDIGYDQSNFSLSLSAPIPFAGDTLPGIGMIPIPMNAPSFQLRLTWDAGQAWEWEAATLYLVGSKQS